MLYRRHFVVFFVSVLLLIFFILLSLYSLFYNNIEKDLRQSKYQQVRAVVSSVYITSKYDLQNVIRDDKYSPQSTVYLYNKKTKSLIFLKGKELSDKYIHDFMQSNIEKIIYLEDGFGYILPQIIDKTLYTFTAIEKGDDIFISVNYYKNNDGGLRLCSTLTEIKKYTASHCDEKGFISVFENRFFVVKLGYEGRLKRELVLLCIVLFIISGLFLSYWVSTHFDLEERRILSEIQNSVESVEKGYMPLVNIKSIYPQFNRLVEQINRLIQSLTSEIDRHKVVYNEHFKINEENKALHESQITVLNIFTTGFSENEYQNLIRSFDLLFSKNGGSLKFKGTNDNPLLVRNLVYVMLELLSHKKGYNLIAEAERDRIVIVSENADFEILPERSVLYNCRNIKPEERRITISL